MEIRHLLSAMWRNRTGPLLIAVQIAIALTALVNVAYVVEQRIEAYFRPTGIDLGNIFWVVSQGYAPDYNHAAVVRADLAYLNSLPGVVAAAASLTLPQTYSGYGLPLSAAPGEKVPSVPAGVELMTEKGIDALGLKLVSGRTPTAEAVTPPAPNAMEGLGKWAPEVVITKALAMKVFPAGDALGKTLYVGLINKSATVVGIVELMQTMPITGPYASAMEQVVFVPAVPPGPGALYLVRTRPGRRAAVMAKVEKELESLQPGRYIARMEALDKTASQTRGWMRSSSIILGVVAALVLVVTAIGIFGLAVFSVTTRTKQIGTRRAIGARRYHILRYFLIENWLVSTLGVLAGCLLAIGVGARLSVMFQMPRLPLYYLALGVMVLWLLGFLAVLLPARRAASISPAVATRTV
jgi:putative ABC transport system permease protein